jgi:hypothetical protein
MVKKGFSAKNSIMYEDYYRREIRGGRDLQSSDIRNLHKDFTNDITSVMEAKVEIVLGKYNRLCYLKLYGPRLQEFPLWSLLIPLSIYIFYGEDLESISRIILFVHHTEHFFKNWKVGSSQKMDLKCNVAAKLARIYDNINPTYFEDRTKKYTIAVESGKRKRGSNFVGCGNFNPRGRNGDFGEWGYSIFVG